MTRRRILPTGPGRVAAAAAATAGILAIGTTAATALPNSAEPGQWPMAGQNLNDTHSQPAHRAISAPTNNKLYAFGLGH
jgi:hypothetical protein